ncbi:MAG: acyl-CoA dehydratase activase-related protein [Clostridia bacterium]|nr:acyl-CoA dehydratase activase-related protein [Clostridia bacterium]
MTTYKVGIDIGSTTVKAVLLNDRQEIIFSQYRRHHAHTQETLREILTDARKELGSFRVQAAITGSGGMGLGKALEIPFVQEVVAVAQALRHQAPQTDAAIELGGEDAKIIYFTGGLEERMNGVCAGGTGSFIDQMASLMQTDAAGLNAEAARYQEIYPIAARCGVFAKSDIQPLINDGATKADLAASVFQAVVNQTISGLACGKPIRGHVAFLGGPLHFLPELRAAFIRTLKLTDETAIVPPNSHLFAAMGAAMAAEKGAFREIDSLIDALNRGVMLTFALKRMEPLFATDQDYQAFVKRHGKDRVKRSDLSAYAGPCYLGVDAGSTTTKLALIGKNGELLWTFYAGNQGNPLKTAISALGDLKQKMPAGAHIARSCSTGYGEELIKSAFSLDEGEVETIAHVTAASFFDPRVDCVLDIGGQDMKCIKLKNGSVDTILLNEACSSGCGSFLENFAASMGYTAQGFAAEALFAPDPVDLGTRCTVFMNSNVKQAQKEGASVQNISAGLAYSVIRNALFKVIKLTDASALGTHVVVQGGTFHNQAVLRAFEMISGVEAVCPDIAGMMGAFGAALIALRHDEGRGTAMPPLEELLKLEWKTATTHCAGCENRCMLTVNTFPGGRRHITGNRCERGLGKTASKEKGPNVSAYKLKRMFDYAPLKNAPRGDIGIPRVLNMWENYPFWHTFFTRLGFNPRLSPVSTRKLYALGMESIPSESECYPAKLAHGHVQWLIDQGIKTIFHPCIFYEHQETKNGQNHYNCPMVCAYPENLKNNVEDVTEGKVRYIRPFLAFTSEKITSDRLVRLCKEEWGIAEKEVRQAVHVAWQEQHRAKADVRAEGKRALQWMEENGKKGILLAGRPYHADPEIHHGIPEMIAGYGLAVLTEDSIPEDYAPIRPVRVNDQWVYHSRLYTAAQFVSERDDLELIQLNSFGCGLDAVTTDQVSDILESCGKLYTVLKIDEVNNLGAARIRVRSLLSAMRMRQENGISPVSKPQPYYRKEFTTEMFQDGYTILAPDMSPIHFELLQPIFARHGYHLEILKNEGRSVVDTGLKYVNNDACYPSILTVGQMMEAVLSGKYDVNRLALIMTQTGGCCRASNYVGFIRRALEKAGLAQIPVISLNFNGMEKNSGFRPSLPMLIDAGKALVLGDLIMKCLYRVRPYEKEKGSANALHQKWNRIIQDTLSGKRRENYPALCRSLVKDFDELPIDEDLKKPRVGIVGEILVKYMPMANNHLAELLEQEGAEAVVPDLMDFVYYALYNQQYKTEFLGTRWTGKYTSEFGVAGLRNFCKPAIDALKRSKRFSPPVPIEHIADLAKPFLSIGNQYGEGWFLCGEMAELLESGVHNIVCIQPFGCLPNHVVGKGVIKQLRRAYPQANIAAVDYDPGASEVNQLNRIKLMLSQAIA